MKKIEVIKKFGSYQERQVGEIFEGNSINEIFKDVINMSFINGCRMEQQEDKKTWFIYAGWGAHTGTIMEID